MKKAAITVGRPSDEVERAWQSSEQRVEDAGATFVDAPGDRGTEIHLAFEAGAAPGRFVRKLTGSEPYAKAKDGLRRFKQEVETGVIARSDASPEGELAEAKLKQRPAQPVEA